MAALTRGGWLALFRTLAPPQPDSDADLLARFVANRDEAALDVLVRRYAGMVLGVCRRRFGDSADADDAFQATFLVLAQQAGTIAKGASLPAWLHRVATLTSLKLAGRTYRRGTAPMTDEPAKLDPPETSAEQVELKGVLDEELSALPDVYRSALVLCGLEGKTNVEAAALLGVPVGTVDSRLHTAKAKLRGRLTKRGIAGAGLTVALPTGIVASDELIRTTVKAAMAFATGGDLAGPLVTTLAREVGSTMTAFKFKLIASTAMILTLAGGVSTGVYFANAGGPQAKAAKAEPKKAEEKPKGAVAGGSSDAVAVKVEVAMAPGTTSATTAVLSKPAGFEEPLTTTLEELFQRLTAQHGVTFRAETAWFKNRGEANVYEKKFEIRITKGLSVQDILDEVAAEFNQGNEGTPTKAGFRVKGNQVILGPVFIPPTAPSAFGSGAEEPARVIGQTEINNMLYGPTVSLSVKDKTLAEIVDLLREQTGANIVLNGGGSEPNRKVTLTLNDTKLFTVLKVVSDMYDLAPATVDNVFYITSPDKAEKMNRETSKALFGEAQPQTVLVPVDKDGKFVPGGLNQLPGGGLGGAGTNLVPVRVEGGEKEKPKPQPKPEEKKQ
jgi:RNA polymerase sigma factor (sigma-70 family)